MNSPKKIEKVVKRITAKVNSYPQNALESVASGVVDVLRGEVDRNVEGAMTALRKLEKYQESSTGPSSSVARFRHQLRTSRIGLTAKMTFSKVIPVSLSEAELYLDTALQEASNIEVHRLNIEILRKLDAILASQKEAETFVAHFDCPELPDNVVLDFCSLETQEGRLLRKLLELREKESVHGLSAVGRGTAIHGMGGVGKTTALRAICHREEVKQAFPGGICFLEFGQNAKDSDVQDQLERCIYNSGGTSIVMKMEEQSSLKGAIKQAAMWLCEKEMLFVCDDLWQSAASDFGYLPLLKRLLRDAPRSKLLVSTRDKRIAEEVSMNYETFGILPSHGPSARSLLGQIAFGDEHIEIMNIPDVQGDVGAILKVCAGLQLALCMAGRALKTTIEDSGDIRKGFKVYASQVERDQRPDETERGAQLYNHGLSYIVVASLVQCEQWAEKSLKDVNVQDLFRSLCVLDKQKMMPKSMISILWGLSSRQTDRVVRKFADLGLVVKTADKMPSESSQNETVEDYSVRLHDLILVLCQEVTGEEQEERHGLVIDALKRSKFMWIDEETPTQEEWWRLKNGGYIYGNLSRHMVKCGRRQELANLLADVRWTLRRVEVGGWLALKTDFELLLGGSDNVRFEGIRQVFELLERHWSEFSKDQRWLAYYIGGSLSGEERKKKYSALYIDCMTRYLVRPHLVPRWKFLGAQEVSLLKCIRNGSFVDTDFSRSTDKAVVWTVDQVSVWNMRAQKELCCFDSRSSFVNSQRTCLAISDDGQLVVSGYADGTFQRWDAESGRQVGIGVGAHEGRVTCLAISEDASTIVTGSRDKTLRMWNAKNGDPIGTQMNHEDEVTCVAIWWSGLMIVSGSEDGTVCRWNIETSSMIGKPLQGHKNRISCVSVGETGRMIVSGAKDKTLLRWDIETGKQVGDQMCGHSDGLRCIALSSCGKMIVSGSWDRTVRLWDAVNGQPIGEPFRGHFKSVTSVGFSDESGMIVSASVDGTIRRWRAMSSARIEESTQKCERGVKDIVFSKDGQKVITGFTDGTLLQWDTNSGMTIGKPMKGRLYDAVLIESSDESEMILAVYTTGLYENVLKNEIVQWNSSTCEMVDEPVLFTQQGYLTCAAVSSNGQMIVTGSENGTMQRHCAITGNTIGESMYGHNDTVKCVAFTANDEIIVTASRDGSIIRWSAADGKQMGKPIMCNGVISCISVSCDGTVIMAHTFQDGLCRWDAISGKLLGESSSKKWSAYGIWTNSDCTEIVTWTANETITRWTAVPGGAICETSTLPLSADVAVCAIDMNHGVAAVALWNGAVAVCDIHE